jgi:cobalt-zinc-cadmium efflux system protein
MAYGHDHPARHQTVSRKLSVATAATAAFVVAQLLIGFGANSLALIGDAIHNFTDTLALLLALLAVKLERRPATSEKSYGYQRAGILAAFINAGALVGLTVYLFIEAFHRFRDPHPVNDVAMLVTALAGIILNVAITLSLRREGREDVNIRSAVIHMVGDALSSVGIVVAAMLIRFTGMPQWDAAISILIGLLILWSSWGILKETVNLLLEGTPSGIDPGEVTRALGRTEGILGVHHLHIWALGPATPAMSCHLMVGDVPVKSTAQLLDQVNEMLSDEYGIAHTTIQFEFANCSEDDPYCVPYTERATSSGTPISGD